MAADLPGERAVQAACGLAHLHGRARGGPRFLGVDYASVCAGVLAAQAVAAAALFRARGGPALSAAVSAAQAALLAAGPHIAAATAPDDGPGAPADPAGRHCTPPFRTSDGVRLEIETLDAEAWADFWADLGASPAAAAAGWPPFQSRFGTARCPLPAELGAVIAARDGRRVRAAARRSGVGLTPIRTAAEAAAAHRPEPEWRLHPATAARPPPCHPPRPAAPRWPGCGWWRPPPGSRARWPGCCWPCSAPRWCGSSRPAATRCAGCRRPPAAPPPGSAR
ncbi:CoA transferase [Nocardiopsis composta]